MEYIIAIACAFILTIIQPILLFPLGVSIFHIIWGVFSLRNFTNAQLIFLVSSSVFLDITLKYTLSTHLISALVFTLALSLSSSFIPDSGGITKLMKVSVSLFISLLLVNFLKDFSLAVPNWGNLIAVSLFSSIIILLFSNVLSMFKSDSNMTKLILK